MVAMLTYAYGHDEEVAGFVARQIPYMGDRGFGRCKTIGVLDDGFLIAGIVYSNWDPIAERIEISAASQRRTWFSRETIRLMHSYPFDQIGCQLVVMHTSEHNTTALRILAALGYAFIRLPRMLGRDEDAIHCSLTVEDWQASRIGRRLTAPAPEPMQLEFQLERAA